MFRWLCAGFAVLAAIGGGSGYAAERTSLRVLVEQRAAQIEADQWQHILMLRDLAQLPLVREYFLGSEKERAEKRAGMEAVLKNKSMGLEMCLIDNKGSEHLRVVRGRLALPAELATDEIDAPFFAPSITLTQDQSYVSPPYFSPDAMLWVVGFVVPVIPGKAILHFEDTLAEYQEYATKGLTGDARFLLLVDLNGFIVADSRREIPLTPKGISAEPKDYFASIKKGPSAFPPELAEKISSGRSGALRAVWMGKTYDVYFETIHGYVVVGMDRVP